MFFDELYEAELLGKDLQLYLYQVYSQRSRYCLVLASSDYKRKIWTKHELRSALERSLNDGALGYLLPVRFDDTDLPGLSTTIGYLKGSSGPEHIAQIVAEKLWLVEQTSEAPKMRITPTVF